MSQSHIYLVEHAEASKGNIIATCQLVSKQITSFSIANNVTLKLWNPQIKIDLASYFSFVEAGYASHVI